MPSEHRGPKTIRLSEKTRKRLNAQVARNPLSTMATLIVLWVEQRLDVEEKKQAQSKRKTTGC